MTALTEPLVVSFDLEHGGTVTFLLFEDGTSQLRVETDCLSLGVPLTPGDVRELRAATGALVCAEAGR